MNFWCYTDELVVDDPSESQIVGEIFFNADIEIYIINAWLAVCVCVGGGGWILVPSPTTLITFY